jgi:hypothetical protein
MAQLKIIQNGVEEAVLIGQQDITVSELSNVYYWDKCLQASFLVDINLPIEGNERYFGWKHLPAVRGGVYEWDAALYDDGKMLYKGKLQLRASERSSFKGSYNFDFVASNLNALIDGKTVREVLTETVEMGSSITDIKQYMTDAANGAYPEYPVAFFPIYAPDFYGEINASSFIGVANYWPKGGSTFELDEPINGSNEPNNGWRYNCVPQVYMLAALVKSFESFGYAVEGDALDDPFMLSICVEGKRAMDRIGGKTAILKTTTEQTFSSLAAIDWQEITQDNIGAGVSTGTTPFTNPPSITKWKLVLEVADCTGDAVSVYITLNGTDYLVKTVLPEIGNSIVVEVEQGEVAATHGFKLSTAGSITLGAGTELVLSDEMGIANFVRGTFELGECLPDVSMLDFMLACKQFGLEYIVDDVQKHVDVRVIKNMLAETNDINPQYVSDVQRVDFTDAQIITMRYGQDNVDTKNLPFIGNYLKKADLPATNATGAFGTGPDVCYAYVINENAYYRLYTNGGGGVLAYSKELLGQRNSKVQVGEGTVTTEYVHKGKLVLMTTTTDTPSSQEYLMPWMEGEGYTDFPGPDYTNFGIVQGGEWALRFVQYYGLQNVGTGVYPQAGVSGVCYDGAVLDVAHLTIDELDNGCWRQYLKPWLEQHKNRDTFSRKMLPLVGENLRTLRGKKIYIEGVYWYAKSIKRSMGDKPWSMELVRKV